jgi:hypothetical protein
VICSSPKATPSTAGAAEAHTLRAGRVQRPGAARLLTDSPVPGLAGTVRFDWAALDAWFEEDEQVFVHRATPMYGKLVTVPLGVRWPKLTSVGLM